MPIWSPEEVRQYQLRVDRSIDSLNTEVAALAGVGNTTFPVADWQRFRTDWKEWLANNSSYFDRMWATTTVNTVDEYVHQLDAWREVYLRNTGTESQAPDITPPVEEERQEILDTTRELAESGGKAFMWPALAIGGGVALALVFMKR